MNSSSSKHDYFFEALPKRSDELKDFVDILYNTKYTEHFYSTQEIDTFRKNWLS